MSASAIPPRAMSCDTNDPTHRAGTIDEGQLPPGISSSSSEHDNHEAGAWSSDYSNSEDEYPSNVLVQEEPVAPVNILSYI